MKSSLRFAGAWLIGLAIAAVLAGAAFFKAGDPQLFADSMSDYSVTPAAWSPVLSWVFIAGEFLLAAALIAFVAPRLTFAATILLMAGFIGVTAWAWAHGHASSCACFGRHAGRGPGGVILEDALIIAGAVAAMLLARAHATPRWRWFAFGVLLIPAAVLVAFGQQLPLDSAIVGLRPGSHIGDMPIEAGGAPTDEGIVLIAIVSEDCPACVDGLPELQRLAENETPRVLAAFAGSATAAQTYRLQHLPNYRVAHASRKVLKRYYRRLPVTLLLEDGALRAVWWQRIPRAEEVQAELIDR